MSETAELMVTQEMISAGRGAFGYANPALDYAAIYRAMAAAKPEWSKDQEQRLILLEENLIGEQKLQRIISERDRMVLTLEADNRAIEDRRDTWERIARTYEARVLEVEAYSAGLAQTVGDKDREIRLLRAERDSWRYMHAQLADKQMATADKVGNHDYHGPRKPILDGDGKPTGKTEAVPDESHERFHGAVGDVLSGNIIRPARDQMERALADARARDDKAPNPIRPVTTSGDPRRIGWPG